MEPTRTSGRFPRAGESTLSIPTRTTLIHVISIGDTNSNEHCNEANDITSANREKNWLVGRPSNYPVEVVVHTGATAGLGLGLCTHSFGRFSSVICIKHDHSPLGVVVHPRFVLSSPAFCGMGHILFNTRTARTHIAL